MVLRGSKLRNTDYVYGIVVFTGHETKIMKNSAKAKYKFSKLEKYSNKAIVMVLVTMLLMSTMAGIVGTQYMREYAQQKQQNGEWKDGAWYLQIRVGPGSQAMQILTAAGTWVILFTNLVPISLLVSLELAKFAQAIFMSYDITMYDEEEDIQMAA